MKDSFKETIANAKKKIGSVMWGSKELNPACAQASKKKRQELLRFAIIPT